MRVGSSEMSSLFCFSVTKITQLGSLGGSVHVEAAPWYRETGPQFQQGVVQLLLLPIPTGPSLTRAGSLSSGHCNEEKDVPKEREIRNAAGTVGRQRAPSSSDHGV